MTSPTTYLVDTNAGPMLRLTVSSEQALRDLLLPCIPIAHAPGHRWEWTERDVDGWVVLVVTDDRDEVVHVMGYTEDRP